MRFLIGLIIACIISVSITFGFNIQNPLIFVPIGFFCGLICVAAALKI